MRYVALVLSTTVLASAVFAEKLTQDQLLNMQKSGLGAPVIIQKIQRDGIAFEPTSDLLIELGKAGVPQDVLTTLLSGGQKQTAAPNAEGWIVASTFYKAGDFSRAAQALQIHLGQNPRDARAKSLLVLALLRGKDREKAKQEYASFKEWQLDTRAQSYVTRLEEVFAKVQAQESFRDSFLDRVRQFDAAGAQRLIDTSALSELQKYVLTVWMAVYQGDIVMARQKLELFQKIPGAEKIASKLQPEIDNAEAVLKESGCIVGWILATPTCEEPEILKGTLAEANKVQITDYLPWATDQSSRISLLKQHLSQSLMVSPLSPTNLGNLFQYTLGFENARETKRVGESILRARGVLRIPLHYMYEKNYCDAVLEIDKINQWVQVLPIKYDFDFREAIFREGKKWAKAKPVLKADYCRPRKIAFADVSIAKQKNVGFFSNMDPLMLGPQFRTSLLFPTVSDIVINFGRERFQQFMRDYGQFVADSLGREDLKKDLITPGSESTAIAMLAGAATVASGVLASRTPQQNPSQVLQAYSLSMMYATQAQVNQMNSVGQATWEALLTAKAFELGEAQLFAALEDLLEGLTTQ